MDNVKALVIDGNYKSREAICSSLRALGFEIAKDVSETLSRSLPEDVKSLGKPGEVVKALADDGDINVVVIDDGYAKYIVHRIRNGANFDSEPYTKEGMAERLLHILVVVTGDSKDKNGTLLQGEGIKDIIVVPQKTDVGQAIKGYNKNKN